LSLTETLQPNNPVTRDKSEPYISVMSISKQYLHSSAELIRPGHSKSLSLLLAVFVFVLSVIRFGGYLLVANDPLPGHADAAVALQGSIVAQSVRIDHTISLLRLGVVPQAILSVPTKSYWGESVPPVARHYLEARYGSDLANRVDFCETSQDINSTEDEARALLACIGERGWRSIIVVTSDYHTRRARLIWRKALRKQSPEMRLWVQGVADPEFQPREWWHRRLYAKTWILECVKLVWAYLSSWRT
jgi:DUF218 domain-containing protein